jgi:CDP-paratose 2-epimerase
METRTKTALVTGCYGNLGCYITKRLVKEGYEVTGIDNDTRGNTLDSESVLSNQYELGGADFNFINRDIRHISWEHEFPDGFDVIVHTAAQVSHPKSIEIPWTDFTINAVATLSMLEYIRNYSQRSKFVFISTSKVYGENVEKVHPILLDSTGEISHFRYGSWEKGINEKCPIDYTLHTPFGVSKIAADMYTQEYGRLYGLATVVLRLNCTAGKYTRPARLQRWEAWFLQQYLKKVDPIDVAGWGGKQVRDIIHCDDVVDAIMGLLPWLEPNRMMRGEVFNIGGGYNNSLSVNECLKRCEALTGHKPEVRYNARREGDWSIYITDTSKLEEFLPEWKIKYDLDYIFQELYETLAPKIVQKK